MGIRAILSLVTAVLALPHAFFAAEPDAAGAGRRWGDLGNGKYRNFVVWSDVCNPDAVRVGDDFYMVASSLHMSPNMTIYHSRDAVNWRMVGHVVPDVTQFSQKYGCDRMEAAGNGSWAAALRYHDGRFWVFVIDPTEGLFMSSAEKAEGPWTPLHLVSGKLKQHDDCCPLWDDDGQAYLVCSDFSKPHESGRKYRVRLFRMSPDGRQLLDEGTVIHAGPIAEANKLYRHNGYYYHMYTEEPGRKQWIARARTIFGPYERKIILQSLSKDPYKPVTQGALVGLKDRRWIYLGQSNYSTCWGWPLALLPVEWKEGWPLVGQDLNGDGIGEMVWEAEKPIRDRAECKLQAGDEFVEAVLQPQWEFNFQPTPDAFSLTARPGFLRLNAKPPLRGNPRNVLTQRLIGPVGTVTARLELAGLADGQRAGLCCLGKPAAWLMVEQTTETRRLRLEAGDKITSGPVLAANQSVVWLRMTHAEDKAQFHYSLDGVTFIPIGEPYILTRWCWMGARPGLFSYNSTAPKGFVDVDWLRYDYQ